MSFNLLPPEIIFSIFSFLHFPDLKAVVQVCRVWRNIGEDPKLWKTLKIVEIHPDDLKTVLSLPRLAKLEYVKISDWLVDKHLKTLREACPRILDISRCYFHEVDPEVNSVDPKLLGEVLNNIEVVNANRAHFSEDQLSEIFQGMSESSRMKTFILNTTDEIDDEDIGPCPYPYPLSHISPDIFAKALNNLEVVHISMAYLTSEHLEALIKYMNKESNIKELVLQPILVM